MNTRIALALFAWMTFFFSPVSAQQADSAGRSPHQSIRSAHYQSRSPDHLRMGISQTYPAAFIDWANAFLAGNGRMGIMVFGDPLNETVIFNDRGFNLASKKPRSFNQVTPAVLTEIRDDCADGHFGAADSLAAEAPGWSNGGEGNRHPGFAMRIVMPGNGVVSHYSRTCDYRTGVIAVRWTDKRGNWQRESFVSRKDNVVVQRLAAPGKGGLTCSIRLSIDPGMNFPAGMRFTNIAATGQRVAADKAAVGGRPSTGEQTAAGRPPSTGELNMRAAYPPGTNGAGYEGVVRVICFGGNQRVKDSVMYISGADSVIMLSRTAKYYNDCEGHWDKKSIQAQLAALPSSYAVLLKGQVATHGAIYDRVSLNLGAAAADRLLSNEALLARQKTDPLPVAALYERLFDAGRYYYLSASSDLTPPDLLGIWTGDCNAGWGGFYHLDANLNLQVSGGNIGDMPEAMEGYFRLNEGWKKDLETNARKLLGCRGLLACGNSPGTTSGLMASINVYYPYQYATGEEGWLLYPFWEHYLVTGDKVFLRNRLYPLLREMGDFYEDFLKRTDSAGHYIFAGSISPENQPSNLRVSLLNNSDFDIAGARFSLTTLLETCKILSLEQGKGQGYERWARILAKLPPYLVNADGALQEWSWPGLEDHYNHRHSSQLLMVWPFQEIGPWKDTALFNAARVTLARKDAYNYENAGHGLLHAALIAASLGNASSVAAKLHRLTTEDFYFNSLCTSHYGNHGVFCTDVCNTVPAIMMEMLVASTPADLAALPPGAPEAPRSTPTPATLELLPALPPGLDKGSIYGVKGRNRVTVQWLSWDRSHHSVSCVLRSDINQSITIIERNGIDTISTQARVSASTLGNIARIIYLPAARNVLVSIGTRER